MIETVAEFTTNHVGHMRLLLRMVHAAKEAGADWIKMQRKDVESFYTPEKLVAHYPSPFGHSYLAYRTMFELSEEDWDRFDRECHAVGVPWFVTAQDILSLEAMLGRGLQRWKVASSNARDVQFLREVAARVPEDCEIVISVAGSTLDQIERALTVFAKHARVWVLHCVAEYPCEYANLRLGNIPVLIDHFADDRIRVGYSGHETGLAPSVVAMDLGAEMIERHFCVSRHSFAHHIECSLESREFRRLKQCAANGEAERKPYWAQVPQETFKPRFGMSGQEKTFLVEQRYGQTYLGAGSRIRACEETQ